MRRNLAPSDLGDLLDRPLNAVLGLHRRDGSILLTPVWHLFKQGAFFIQALVATGRSRSSSVIRAAAFSSPRMSIPIGQSRRAVRVGSRPTTTRKWRSRSYVAMSRHTIQQRAQTTTCWTAG